MEAHRIVLFSACSDSLLYLLLKFSAKRFYIFLYILDWASQVALVVKNPPANSGDIRDRGFNPWVQKIPWRREWQPTPVFLPGKSRAQRSLAGYSPQGRKESDTTEAT